MTEDEAKTKWCPFVQVAINQYDLVSNRGERKAKDGYSSPEAHAHCIGSACMAFRYTYSESDASHVYCGLAGKP